MKIETLENALALRDRVREDLTAQRRWLDDFRAALAKAEKDESRSALAQYEKKDAPSIETIRSKIAELTPAVSRTEDALREVEQRVRDARARETAAFVESQGREVATLRKRFRNAAQQLAESFDALKAWEAQFESAGLNAPQIELLESIALGAPRCPLPEFERHVRNFTREAV